MFHRQYSRANKWNRDGERQASLPQDTEQIESSLPLDRLHALARSAMFAALIAAGAFIIVPFGPLHFTLQTMMVILAGFCLGSRRGCLSVVLYLAAGLLGIPVFGRGRSGPAAFLSPAGGYLPGFLVAAALAGTAAGIAGRRCRLAVMAMAGTAGAMVILAAGAAGLRLTVAADWNAALTLGALPFVPGDLLKVALAMGIREAFFPGPARRGEKHA